MKWGIEERLRNWKTAARRKPLIVRGARQVGKTWSIDQFGQAEFRNVATIDFEKRPTLKPLFTGDLSPAVLVEQLELATGQRIRPGETLLFLDEIQACPRAVTALRYFHEELPSLHVVAAGSLLDFALARFPCPSVASFIWRCAPDVPGVSAGDSCGILCFGFGRARCASGGQGFVVAFSCKGRGVCPSCNGCRMARDSCASRRPRHSPGARVAMGDLRAEAIALLPR